MPYLNVDLDLVAQFDLSELVEAFAPPAFPLLIRHDPADATWHTTLELASDVDELEVVILEFASIVAGLPMERRADWSRCDDKCFSLGVQAGRGPYCETFALSGKAIAAIAQLGACVEIAVYGAQVNEAATSADTGSPRDLQEDRRTVAISSAAVCRLGRAAR